MVFVFWKRGLAPENHVEEVFNLLFRGLIGFFVHFDFDLWGFHRFCDKLGNLGLQVCNRASYKVVCIVAELDYVLGVIGIATICLIL